MNENVKTIIEYYTLNKFEVAAISASVSVLVFLFTNLIKNYFEGSLFKRNLEAEHVFNQQKLIKEVLAKNKVHLLTACEELNHRMWNFAKKHNDGWLVVNGDYCNKENYYFHSFAYRLLRVYAWVKIIQGEMIFLDSTIASKGDLEFIKFLRVFPQIFCDLSFIEGKDVDGNFAIDHFFKNNFDLLPDSILEEKEGSLELRSFSLYMKNLTSTHTQLVELYKFLDGVSPNENNRKRWDRLHLLNLVLVIFLNSYGYDFQKTDEKKFEEILTKPKFSAYSGNLFSLLTEYRLNENREVRGLERIYKNIAKR